MIAVFLWSIQIQLLLQIIINRIRVILLDRTKVRVMSISVAIIVLCINISVFCIWIPARLQISQRCVMFSSKIYIWLLFQLSYSRNILMPAPRYIHINNIWDRTEKVIYLILDACLNWYFIRTVKHNLVVNGLQKYSRLVRFNQRIIIISLLMDVMIIGAMSIPNGFL